MMKTITTAMMSIMMIIGTATVSAKSTQPEAKKHNDKVMMFKHQAPGKHHRMHGNGPRKHMGFPPAAHCKKHKDCHGKEACQMHKDCKKCKKNFRKMRKNLRKHGGRHFKHGQAPMMHKHNGMAPMHK